MHQKNVFNFRLFIEEIIINVQKNVQILFSKNLENFHHTSIVAILYSNIEYIVASI